MIPEAGRRWSQRFTSAAICAQARRRSHESLRMPLPDLLLQRAQRRRQHGLPQLPGFAGVPPVSERQQTLGFGRVSAVSMPVGVVVLAAVVLLALSDLCHGRRLLRVCLRLRTGSPK